MKKEGALPASRSQEVTSHNRNRSIESQLPAHTRRSHTGIDKAVSQQPKKVLTGDTLFIGDVVVPTRGEGIHAADVAGMSTTLCTETSENSDEVEVSCPRSGSMCGANLTETSVNDRRAKDGSTMVKRCRK